jgi:tetratricopeptide (TPR) repeat protein
MKTFFILFIAAQLLISAQTRQNDNVDSVITRGIDQIYSIRFEDAERTFRNLISDYPNNPAGRFFLAMVDWWRILLDLDDESRDDIFFEKLEDVINQCDVMLDSNPDDVDALFFKGGAIGFRGRLHAIRESWLKAADDGREALPIVRHAAKLDPNNKDIQLGFGVYDYYAGVIPDEFPMVKPLMIFFPEGDRQRGIQELKETAQSGKYAKIEARYFLMMLYDQYEKNAFAADEYATMLVNDYPNNPVFQRWKGRLAVKEGDQGGYFAIFSDVYTKVVRRMPGYYDKAEREASYYIGLYYRTISVADSALKYFEICERVSKRTDRNEPSGYQINAILYAGMMNDALGRRDQALSYYRRVLDMKEFGSSREYAKTYIEKPFAF